MILLGLLKADVSTHSLFIRFQQIACESGRHQGAVSLTRSSLDLSESCLKELFTSECSLLQGAAACCSNVGQNQDDRSLPVSST